MNEDISAFDKYVNPDHVIGSARFAFHCAHPEVSYDDYRDNQRGEIRNRIQSKRINYLDTNAWKCLSDSERGKKTLTAGMVDFADTMNSDRVRTNCVFPIGSATIFELQSMDDPESMSAKQVGRETRPGRLISPSLQGTILGVLL
ncbi:hypothetical protein RBA41_20295 [Massilia sp. CCM 9210]|uniref:hypothetical protein n=1 Tax=Massilia scottii TaxID=3057166 RepID=UPI002796C2A9|nr:hypothetical protein [Massilia sp. CCM 9210]MDQ1815641.1 hypothetical protein [Massilia sp. CCM 9210]